MRSKVRAMNDEGLDEILDSLQCLSENISFIGDEMLGIVNKVRELIEKVELERDIKELERTVGKLEDSRDKAGR